LTSGNAGSAASKLFAALMMAPPAFGAAPTLDRKLMDARPDLTGNNLGGVVRP
jgi:hypothetical protein